MDYHYSSQERLGKGNVKYMRNSSIYRSNLSDEKVAFLSEIKSQKELNEDENTPKAYRRPAKQKELDILWENFKINTKEDKSPGIYLLTGFVAGALCIFLMNGIISVSSNLSNNAGKSSLGQPKFDKKISRKSTITQMASQTEVIPAVNTAAVSVKEQVAAPRTETYTVKSGDSMSTIVHRFYGKYDVDKIQKIKQVNNLTSAHKLSIGQKLTIPLD